jgi:uncharacterized membrane protein
MAVTVASKKLGWALAVSIGINLFVVGVLAARWLHPWAPGVHGDHGAPHRGGHLLFRAGEAFGGDREKVQATLEAHRKELRAQWRNTRTARRRVHEALEAEPFDPEALEGALKELRRQTELSQEILHRALAGLAREATPEERRRLARWADGPPRFHPRAASPAAPADGAD